MPRRRGWTVLAAAAALLTAGALALAAAYPRSAPAPIGRIVAQLTGVICTQSLCSARKPLR